MMNIPGDVIRRATANITSISSTVANVVPSRRRRDHGGSISGKLVQQHDDSILNGAKEKISLSVKCTPNKDAATTTLLSIKSGYMMKRNEQGIWHKKYICTVPHIFMYYFDSEIADAPRGIIDLELYTQMSVDGTILKMSTSDEEVLRSFYFEGEDRRYLEEWSTSMIRDRYNVVYEEREAYQNIQFEMSGAIDSVSQQRLSSQQEKESLEKELLQSKKMNQDSINALQEVLVRIGVTEDEMKDLYDVRQISSHLLQRILELRNQLEKCSIERKEEVIHEREVNSKLIHEYQQIIEKEQFKKKELEIILQNERQKSEEQLRLYHVNLDDIHLNMQLAVTEKQSLDMKCQNLHEQKKVLVKEVKQLRKKNEMGNEMIKELKGLNEQLVATTQSLQNEMNALRQKLLLKSSDHHHEGEGSSPIGGEGSSASSGGGVGVEGLEGEGQVQEIGEEMKIQTEKILQKNEEMLSSFNRMSYQLDENEVEAISSPTADSTSHLGGGGGGSDSISPLRDLDWLSDEQKKLIGSRYAPGSVNNRSSDEANKRLSTHQSRTGSIFSFLGTGMQSNPSNDTSIHTDSISHMDIYHTNNSYEHAPITSASSGSSNLTTVSDMTATAGSHPNQNTPVSGFRRFSNLFSGTSNSNGPSQSSNNAPLLHDDMLQGSNAGNEPTGTSKSFFSSFSGITLSNTESEDKERLPQSMRLKCLRCDGTVEGPKYSTCKCTTPALNQEDLLSSASSGSIPRPGVAIISGVSFVAGGLVGAAGGIMKVTTQSVGGLMHTTAGALSSGGVTDRRNSVSSTGSGGVVGVVGRNISDVDLVKVEDVTDNIKSLRLDKNNSGVISKDTTSELATFTISSEDIASARNTLATEERLKQQSSKSTGIVTAFDRIDSIDEEDSSASHVQPLLRL